MAISAGEMFLVALSNVLIGHLLECILAMLKMYNDEKFDEIIG